MAKRRRRAVSRPIHGEDALAEIEEITLTLESGRKRTFNIAHELEVSDDPQLMREQALTAHARYAFWAYQAERALRALRDAEIAQAKVEGEKRWRAAQIAREQDRFASTATIEGLVSNDHSVSAGKERLNQLRQDWTMLRAVAEALDHRTHLLRRLLARDQTATRGE
tara:strand:- start:3711 stop:4211 length:501 start_codon:yes stop_codon:yes gene_type:complete